MDDWRVVRDDVIYDRHKAGESIALIAEDYGLTVREVADIVAGRKIRREYR